jgi:hypothetical protein
MIQSIIFPRDKFNLLEAIEWLRAHRFHSPKVDTTTHFYRFRQHNPIPFGHYRTKTLPNGVEMIFHYHNE